MKKTVIKILSMLAALAMTFALCIPAVFCGVLSDNIIIANQSSNSKESFLYIMFNDGTCAITGYVGNHEEITIPEAITTANDQKIPVTAIMASNDTHYIFSKKLTIPAHVKYIGAYAFDYISIDVEELIIEADGLTISETAFLGMRNVKNITVKGNVADIGSRAFAGCMKLENITLPDGITKIPNGMLAGCSALKSITIPDTVTQIGQGAFSGCKSLKTVNMSKNIDSIASNAFEGTAFADSYKETADDGVIYSGSAVVGIDRNKLKGRIVIREGTVSIEDNVFYGNDGITELVMPDSLKYIGDRAFIECEALTNIRWSKNLETIGQSAFANCNSLESITIPSSVKKVGMDAFSNCQAVKEIIIEDGAGGFEYGTFSRCNGLTEVYVPGSVKVVCSRMFSNCKNLRKVVLGIGITKISEGAFFTSGLRELTIPYTVDTIERSIIQNCVELGVVNYGGSEDEWNAINRSTENNWLFVYATFNYGNCPVAQFVDMPKVSNWKHPGLRYCVGAGIMNGSSYTTVSPDGITSRAQLVTLLWRLEGSPSPNGAGAFEDLTADWYKDAVVWAAEKGIVKGTSETTFSPDANVTRQEAATFIFRYAEYKGYDTKARIDISTFPDNKSIQNFAKDAVSWANATRIITGASHSGKVVLDPRGIATRAQIATILMRFCEIYGAVGTEK